MQKKGKRIKNTKKMKKDIVKMKKMKIRKII